jgi:hypothetical protein
VNRQQKHLDSIVTGIFRNMIRDISQARAQIKELTMDTRRPELPLWVVNGRAPPIFFFTKAAIFLGV